MTNKIDCPQHLQTVKTGSVHSITVSDNEIIGKIYVDGTPSKKLLLTKEILSEIQSAWDNDKVIHLQFSGGTIRKDDVMISNSIKVETDENESPSFM
jgi:hypothetical protein